MQTPPPSATPQGSPLPGLPDEIRGHCNRIAAEVTSLHRAAARLPEGAERGEVLKALFELTRQVEVVKKQVRKLEGSDTSRLV